MLRNSPLSEGTSFSLEANILGGIWAELWLELWQNFARHDFPRNLPEYLVCFVVVVVAFLFLGGGGEEGGGRGTLPPPTHTPRVHGRR